MPNIGYESPSGDDSELLIVMRGNVVTMPQAGAAGVTVTFRCGDDANTPGDNLKAGIFSAGALLAESAVRNDISVQAEYAFSGGGFATFTPANGATYQLMLIGDDGSVYAVYDNVTAGTGLSVSDDNVSVFGPPMAFGGTPTPNTSRSYIAYMTYSLAGGGSADVGWLRG